MDEFCWRDFTQGSTGSAASIFENTFINCMFISFIFSIIFFHNIKNLLITLCKDADTEIWPCALFLEHQERLTERRISPKSAPPSVGIGRSCLSSHGRKQLAVPRHKQMSAGPPRRLTGVLCVRPSVHPVRQPGPLKTRRSRTTTLLLMLVRQCRNYSET